MTLYYLSLVPRPSAPRPFGKLERDFSLFNFPKGRGVEGLGTRLLLSMVQWCKTNWWLVSHASPISFSSKIHFPSPWSMEWVWACEIGSEKVSLASLNVTLSFTVHSSPSIPYRALDPSCYWCTVCNGRTWARCSSVWRLTSLKDLYGCHSGCHSVCHFLAKLLLKNFGWNTHNVSITRLYEGHIITGGTTKHIITWTFEQQHIARISEKSFVANPCWQQWTHLHQHPICLPRHDQTKTSWSWECICLSDRSKKKNRGGKTHRWLQGWRAGFY